MNGTVKFTTIADTLEISPNTELLSDEKHLLTLVTRLKRLMLCDPRGRDLRNFDPDYTSLDANCGLVLRLGHGLCIIYEIGFNVEITLRILHDETMLDCKILSFPQSASSQSYEERSVQYMGQTIKITGASMPKDYYSPIVQFFEASDNVSAVHDSQIVEEFMEILYDYTDYATVIENIENA